MKQRLLEFDIAKAICIVLVAIGHYVPEGAPVWYDNIHDWIYTFHMPVFLFSSGYIYLTFKKDEPYGTFVAKKLKRLMLPYLVVSVLILTIKLLSQKGMYVQNPVTFSSYLKILYLPEAGYFLWFVWSLFTMFCIVPLLKTKTIRLIVFGIEMILHYWQPLEFPHIFSINETVRNFVWFMLGCVCCDYKSMVAAIGQSKLALMKYACVLAFIICTGALSLGLIGRNFFLIPWSGIAAVMIMSKAFSERAGSKWMQPVLMVGSASFTIYLFHTTFMGFAKSFVHKVPILNGGDGVWFTVGAIIVVTVGIVCPMLLHKYILPRWKVTRFIFGLK